MDAFARLQTVWNDSTVDSFRFGIGISYTRICMSYFPDFIIPKSLEKIFVRGNFAFLLFLFSSSSSLRPGWKENGGNLRLYSFLFVLSFFLFLRGIIKEKKDYLCKAAHHLFIPSAHVTFRDNTWYRACLNLRISRVYRSALANNRWFYFNISATFLRAAVSSIESPRPTVTNFFDRANISAYIVLFASHKRKEKKKKENLEKNIF